MKILVIDTCGATGSVSIADISSGPAAIASVTLPGRSASERLVATIKDLTSRPGFGLESLGAVAVVHAPAHLPVCVSASAPPKACAKRSICRSSPSPGLQSSPASPLRPAAASSPSSMRAAASSTSASTPAASVSGKTRHARPTLYGNRVRRRNRGTNARHLRAQRRTISRRLRASPRRRTHSRRRPAHHPLSSRVQDFDDVATIDANYLRRTDAEIFAKPTAATPSPGTPAR